MRSLTCLTLMVLLPACGELEDLFGGSPSGQAQPGNPEGYATADADMFRPLSGEVYGLPFVPRSIIFATGINLAGLEETHILASTARNYCEHIRDGIEEERSLRVMLRVVHYVGDQLAGHVVPGTYAQAEAVSALDDTLGVPPPGQVPVEGGAGRALTAGLARVRPRCGGQRIFATDKGTVLGIAAHDFTGIRGYMSLQFQAPKATALDPNQLPDPNRLIDAARGRAAVVDDEGLNETLPIRVGGTFVATPCPWLGRVLDRDPQAPFRALQCMGSYRN